MLKLDRSSKYMVYSFYRLLVETNECLTHRIMIPALCGALTIPAVCGKVLYPNATLSAYPYIAWYDEVQGKDEVIHSNADVKAKFDSYLNDMKAVYGTGRNFPRWPVEYGVDKSCGIFGRVVYGLRCAVLHAGDLRIQDNAKEYADDYEFVLTYNTMTPADIEPDAHIIEVCKDGHVKCYINIDKLCKCMIFEGSQFFLDHINEFEDHNMRVLAGNVSILDELFRPDRPNVSYSRAIFKRWNEV